MAAAAVATGARLFRLSTTPFGRAEETGKSVEETRKYVEEQRRNKDAPKK